MINVNKKIKNILTGIFCLGIFINLQAQDSTAMAKVDIEMRTSEAEAGENITIYNTSDNNNRKVGCSLVQNESSVRKIETLKNGYRIITGDYDEVITVKRDKNGSKKIRYYNGYEDLKYHENINGESHYKYSYYNECQKVKVRKNKKGIVNTRNKAENIDHTKVQENVLSAVNKGVQTCSASKFER